MAVKATDPNGNIRTNTYQVSESGATKNFTYDANGNMTGDGTKTYIWDNDDRLVEVKQGTTSLAVFNYNGSGLRGNKIASATSVTYIYDGSSVLEERAASTRRYIYGPGLDRPVARVDAGIATYNVADHLGNVVRTTDSSGNPTLAREFDPWGGPLQGAATSGVAFTGRDWDAETSLYYFRSRYYDPKTARFLSEDPLRVLLPFSAYAYVNNSPLTLIDPDGLVARSHFKETESDEKRMTGPCSPTAWGCTWVPFKFSAGKGCRPRNGKWGFDLDVYWNITTVYTRPRNSVVSSGESLEIHENDHRWELTRDLATDVINREIRTEGFLDRDCCDAAIKGLSEALARIRDAAVEKSRRFHHENP